MENGTKSNTNPWLIGFISWLVPGLGHVMLGRFLKGLLGGATVALMFLTGVLIGGHIYGLKDTSEGLLSSLFGLCDLGAGLLYLGSRIAGFAANEMPDHATAEYGSVFLMVSGLLNLILALDAFDIRVGRKS